MPRMHELAPHTLTTRYTPPTCSTWSARWYFYLDCCFPYPFLPDGLPRDPRARPELICTADETYPPWVYGPAPRYCRHCHTIVFADQWSPSGLCKGSCLCRRCAALYARSIRMYTIARSKRSWVHSDAFFDLPRSERLAYLDEIERLETLARRLYRPVPPPHRILTVPGYWHAPAQTTTAAPLPRVHPPHVKGATHTLGAVVFDPKSRPWKRFLSSLKASAPSTYDDQHDHGKK